MAVPSEPLRDGRKPVRFGLLISICGVFAVVLGLAALFGWAIGVPFLASLGSGRIPMAPSTAVLFVMYGVTVFLRSRFSHRGVYWTGLSIHAAGALLTLLVMVMSYQGIHPEAEHLGFTILHTPGVTPLGHMSRLTALCFLLTSLSFLASLSTAGRRQAIAALFLACLLLMTSFLLVLAYLFGTPLLYGGTLIPPALTTSLAFMAFGIALSALVQPHAWKYLLQDESATPFPYAFFMIFAILTAGIMTAGYLSYLSYEKHYRTGVERQLSAIADLKVAELRQWESERLADAGIIYGNATFTDLAQRYLKNPLEKVAELQLGNWLKKYPEHYEYDGVRLIDPQGVTRMSFPPERTPVSPAVLKRIPEVIQSKRVTIVDFYRYDLDQRIYISLLIPILDESAGNRAIGIVALRIDPEKYLYPFILRWPTPSPTAETLIVRREGNDVLFLSELKSNKNSALNIRVSLKKTDVAAVKAVLGQTGIVEGIDNRGAQVIADVRPVPDSPWFMVTRMNASEVFAPARGQLWIIIGFAAALLFGSGAALTFVWRRQNISYYREKYRAAEELRESEEKFRALYESAKDGIFLLSGNGNLIALNMSFASMHGYTVEEIQKMGLKDLDTPESAALAPARMQRLLAGEPLIFEVEHYCKNGQRIPLEVSANLVTIGDEKFILEFHRDITERKNAETELKRSNEELQQFAYIASHDLQEPLRMIASYLQLIEKRYKGKLDRDADEFISFAVDGALRLQEMIIGLLNYSRVGTKVISFQEVHTSEVLATAILNLKTSIEDSGALVTADRLPVVKAVASQLVQVFQNLISNSLKFRSKEIPRIHVSAERKGEEWVYSVRDNGIGIAPEYRDRIFNIFQRLHGREYPGIGIGLSLCRRIIEKHGGRIWFESEAGKGTTFYFTIPVEPV